MKKPTCECLKEYTNQDGWVKIYKPEKKCVIGYGLLSKGHVVQMECEINFCPQCGAPYKESEE